MNQPRHFFLMHPTLHQIISVVQGVRGYEELPHLEPEQVVILNSYYGNSAADLKIAESASMFGWETPAASGLSTDIPEWLTFKYVKYEIDWHILYANQPRLNVYIDKLPDFYMQPHHVGPGNILYCTINDLVSFIKMGSNGIEPRTAMMGFGGSTMSRLTTTGQVIESNDCWSSRAECVDIPCKDVMVYETESRSGCAGLALRTSVWEKAVTDLGAFVIDGVISSSPDTLTKPEADTHV
ncbi:MAG: hypothetical protein COA78_28455 [Blastopirellula sp.]|nr:MAG: hypothetical protein COA78_28455 [Blastopirellula sp.]